MISLAAIRKHLALPKTSWQICLLAIIGGCASALLVVLFTLTIEEIQQFYLLKRDNYNTLEPLSRFALPLLGAIMILCIAWVTGYQYLRTGIPFVLYRLKIAHGVIPFKNTLNQFWGSVVALTSGFSVGREGPAVHLGAACSSYVGDLLKLPYNSIRTLCACGIAAGIAATFNTPIAAVIFVMEVILREYKIHVFIPIMLAALIGSLITRSVFGTSHSFEYFNAVSLGQEHYLALGLLGVFLGFLAAIFNKYLVIMIKHSVKIHIIPRLMIAALITGSLGYFIPGAMGTGTGAIDTSLVHHWQIALLFALLFAKLLMTIFALGLGIPGGIVGPVIAIGAIAGAWLAAVAIALQIIPNESVTSDYILMGMAGFMAASLNAPLAALLAVVELSSQLEIIVPAMIVITIASIVSRQIFNNGSVFTMQLDVQNLQYRMPPIEESLQKIGVLAVMKVRMKVLYHASERSLSSQASLVKKNTLVINKVLSNKGVAYYWAESAINSPAIPLPNTAKNSAEDKLAKTLPIGAFGEEQAIKKIRRHKLIPLSNQATLAEAYLALVNQRCGGVYIYQDNTNNMIGVVTFEQLRYYLIEGRLT